MMKGESPCTPSKHMHIQYPHTHSNKHTYSKFGTLHRLHIDARVTITKAQPRVANACTQACNVVLVAIRLPICNIFLLISTNIYESISNSLLFSSYKQTHLSLALAISQFHFDYESFSRRTHYEIPFYGLG